MRRREPNPTPATQPARVAKPKLPPRLISFGTRTVTCEGRHNRYSETEYESAYDAAHPCDIYYRQVGTTEWHRKDPEATTPTNTVVDSFVMRRLDHTPTHGNPAAPDVHVKLPPLTPEERAAGQAIAGTNPGAWW